MFLPTHTADTPAPMICSPVSDDEIRLCVYEWELAFGTQLDSPGAGLRAAFILLKHYLGEDWVMKHVFAGAKGSPYMHPMNDPRPRHKAEEFDFFRWNLRIFRLAEMLLNFETVEGFAGRIKRLKDENVETATAELEAASLLHGSGIPFRFVDERGEQGLDYDVEALLGGIAVACETKCKEEGTDRSEGTIRESLKKARKQLPDDMPGVVFIKIPELWTRDPALEESFTKAINQLFRTSGRVSAVIAFWESIGPCEGHGVVLRILRGTFHNPNARVPLKEFGGIVRVDTPSHWRSIQTILFPACYGKSGSIRVTDLTGDPIQAVDDVLIPEVPCDWQVSVEERVFGYNGLHSEVMDIHQAVPADYPSS